MRTALRTTHFKKPVSVETSLETTTLVTMFRHRPGYCRSPPHEFVPPLYALRKLPYKKARDWAGSKAWLKTVFMALNRTVRWTYRISDGLRPLGVTTV